MQGHGLACYVWPCRGWDGMDVATAWLMTYGPVRTGARVDVATGAAPAVRPLEASPPGCAKSRRLLLRVTNGGCWSSSGGKHRLRLTMARHSFGEQRHGKVGIGCCCQ